MKSRLTILVLILVLLFSFFIAGCSAINLSPDENPSYANNDNKEGSFGENDTTDAEKSNANYDNRKIIYTSSIDIETTDYEKSIIALESLVEKYNGFMQSSRVETNTQANYSNKLRQAFFSIRIPSDMRKAFITDSGNVGKIIRSDTTGEDVTDTFFDTEARIAALTTQETRLVELLAEAENLKDILDIEDRLSTVRYQLDSLTGTLDKLSSLVDLSTVDIQIDEVESISPPSPNTFGEEIVAAFKNSTKALVATLKTLLIVITVILPFIVVAGIIALIIILIVKSITRRSSKKQKNDPPKEDNK